MTQCLVLFSIWANALLNWKVWKIPSKTCPPKGKRKKKKKIKTYHQPGESVTAAILRKRFFASIFSTAVLNCSLCTATLNSVCLQTVFKLQIFFLTAERHDPMWHVITETISLLWLRNWETGVCPTSCRSFHRCPQTGHFAPLCPTPGVQLRCSQPAALPTSPRCLWDAYGQRPWHSYSKRVFQIPEISRAPAAGFTYGTPARFHFDRQTQPADAAGSGPGIRSEAPSGCWTKDPLGALLDRFDTPLHHPGFGAIWVVLGWPDKHFCHGLAYKTLTVRKFGRLPPATEQANTCAK